MIETGVALRRCGRVLAFVAAASFWLYSGAARAQVGSDRYSSIVVDTSTGAVLSASAADELRHPASLTKMMTLYMLFLALEEGSVSTATRIPVSRHAASQPPSKLWLKPGSTITVRDAILAVVTKSANDVASAVGEFLGGGSERRFANLMTLRARSLGMSRTVFRNASGLPDPGQVTTARDMALLGQRLISDFPRRYSYFSTAGFNWHGRRINGHNRVVEQYEGADGIKTGFINSSGFNIVVSAARDGRRLVAVVFGGATSNERDRHVMALMDRGFGTTAVPVDTEMRVARAPVFPGLAGSARAATVLAPLPETKPLLRRATAAVRLPPPVAPSTTVRTPRTAGNPHAGWAAQVGALPSARTARQAVADARRHGAGRGGRSLVEPVRVRGATLFRAQIAGLTQAEARQACRKLRPRACMVVAP
ncbi:serine hydrolase [Roseomonas elaeocarpi]|uniref:Serine hydrolase n=1 Tax=Roseomonas elaeocarpi TaxID=907779 RepID=A0ABV6JT17_9PROT